MTTLSICWSAIWEIAIALGIAAFIIGTSYVTLVLIFSRKKNITPCRILPRHYLCLSTSIRLVFL